MQAPQWWPPHCGPVRLSTGEAGAAQDVPSLKDLASCSPTPPPSPHRKPTGLAGQPPSRPSGLASVSPPCSEGQRGIVTVAPEAVRCLHIRKEAYGPNSAAHLRSGLWPYRFRGTRDQNKMLEK